MKRIIASIVLALMVFALPIALVGCSNKESAAPKTLTKEYLIGNWKFYDFVVENGAKRPADSAKEMYADETLCFFENYLKWVEEKEDYYYDYEVKDDGVVLCSKDGHEDKITYKNGMLLFSYDNDVYIAYKKVSK